MENDTEIFYSTIEESNEPKEIVEEQNQIITDTALLEYPRIFEEIILDDGSNVAFYE